MDLTREQLLKIIDNLGKKLAQAQLDIAVLEMRLEELSKQQGQLFDQPFLITKKYIRERMIKYGFRIVP